MNLFKAPSKLYGKKVIVSPSYPAMQLSESCPVSEGFRKEFNEWLLNFFGTKCAVPRGIVYFVAGDNTVVVNPEDYEMLKAMEL